MRPITINITNLIGTMVIVGDKDKAPEQIKEIVTDALLKVLATAENLESQESYPNKTLSQAEDPENQE